MWIQESILRLWNKLSQTSYDFILNYGVCWYTRVQDPCIQVVRSLDAYSGKELLPPVFFTYAPLSTILCSEIPIDSPANMQGLEYVDMESYAVEKLAEFYKIPRLIIKVPADKVWEETKNFDKKRALEILSQNIDFWDLISKICAYLETLAVKQDTKLYHDFFSFTQTEWLIFEKYFHAYNSLAQEDLSEFFHTHKHLTKKVFLKQLERTLSTLKNKLW